MAGCLHQLVASAVRAELAILHTAPVLLESFAQLHSLVQARTCSSTACNAFYLSSRCNNNSAVRKNSAGSSHVLAMQHTSSTTEAGGIMHCHYAQQRMASNNSAVTDTNDVIYMPDDSNASTASAGERQDWQGAYRRGFGAKVALPPADILHEVLMDQPATIKMRAYHIGARIHIGQVAQRAKLEGCRINSGKDYCIIWLTPSKHKFHGGSSGTSEPSSSSSSSGGNPSGAGASRPHFSMDPAIYERLQLLRKQLLSRAFLPVKQGKQEQRRHQLPRWAATAPRVRSTLLGPVDAFISSTSHVEPLLVVYRYGSVVFAGTQPADEPGLVDEYVPSSVQYKAGGDSTWTQPNPMLQSRSPVEEHMVQVVPSQLEHAKKGADQVLLRVLDIGGVRVLTSVLAQSAALKFYETSVAEALDKLAQYRARVRAAQADRTGWYGSAAASLASMSGEQERTFFKVIAASALVMNEARELLEIAEPAWQYAAYHSIWVLAADDFELERRLKGLELKLRQVEKEAKHDVKDKAGRRYHRLEQSVVWLLVVSCLLAALEVSKKVMAKSCSSSSSSYMGLRYQGAAIDDDITGNDANETEEAAAAAVDKVSAAEWIRDSQDMQCAAEQQHDSEAAERAGASCDHDAAAAAAHARAAAGGDEAERWLRWGYMKNIKPVV